MLKMRSGYGVRLSGVDVDLDGRKASIRLAIHDLQTGRLMAGMVHLVPDRVASTEATAAFFEGLKTEPMETTVETYLGGLPYYEATGGHNGI
jgi:hypothetical protein